MSILDEVENLNYSTEAFSLETLEEIRKYSRVIIWGASLNAKKALKLLNDNNIKVDCLYDDSPKKQNTIFAGFTVMKSDIEHTHDCAFVIACIGFNAIYKKLVVYNKNIRQQMFLFEAHEIEEDYSMGYLLRNEDKINKVYNMLNDERSKEIFLNLIKYRYTRNSDYIEGYVEDFNCQYLDQVLVDNYMDGYIIDAGAYDGDSIIKFSKKIDLTNSFVYAFEPDKKLCLELNENLKSFSHYKVFPLALYDEKTTVSFSPSLSGSGMVSSLGEQVIDTDRLDDLVTDEHVSLIKMDIEGSEVNALRGAVNTIKKNEPICAISIYHKRDDLWEIPLLIDSLGCEYDFYMRHYTFSLSETVLYCIPRKSV